MTEPNYKVIADNPIGNDLDAFRQSFRSICKENGVSTAIDSLGQLNQEDLQNLVLDLLSALRKHAAVSLLRSKAGRGTLRTDLLKLVSAVASDDFDYERVKPLLRAALSDKPDDETIWNQVCNAATESTPPPRPIASTLEQTPWIRNTSSFANTSEYRKYVDAVLKEELGPIYVGLRGFHQTFFGGVAGLETASKAVFDKCMEGDDPLFRDGWISWPKDPNQEHVLSWFAGLCDKLAAFAEEHRPTPSTLLRRPLAQPNKPIDGSVGKRKLDVGFVSDPMAQRESRCHWSQILVPGELKSNQSADTRSVAGFDLGRYAREVLAAQDARRFVLGFTLCGSLMRVWEFDRIGGIASDEFDINKDGLRFVTTILGFLWMSDEELGFDPTIRREDSQRFIEIKRNGLTERLVLDAVMMRARCIAGRATTCWKAHREGDPQTPLVIKDSWQYQERNEEGELLREATDKGVVNVARYYYHETVQVCGAVDDIQSNVRKGLDITTASSSAGTASRKGWNSSIAGLKRQSSQIDASLPSSKRLRSTSRAKIDASQIQNRVRRRVIIRDYGKPIYESSSRAALLAALKGCVEGHESLRNAGFLHRDISINNLMINEDSGNPSWFSFLIDLDLAIREPRVKPSGAQDRTGTRAFMAIGTLLGEQHSFMHDLESFFWVLFWICIHYDGPQESRVIPVFDQWNYVDMEELAKSKLGTVAKEDLFIKTVTDHFTPYYQPLIPWINRLRRQVFPLDKPWEREDSTLYSRIVEILDDAQKDEDAK